MEVLPEENLKQKIHPHRMGQSPRKKFPSRSKSKKPYSPSDYCFECVNNPGGIKCKTCENIKAAMQVLSFTSFQEGPKKKRVKPSYICSLHCKYDIVRHVASKLGMKESLDNWNVLWSDFTVTCERIKNLKRYQKVNHFPGMIEICRKDLLARNLNRMFKLFPDDYDFYPRTWLLPTDYNEVLEYAKCHKNKTYILKPDLGCKGKGISLTRSIKHMSGMERTICQTYVSKPFLIDGFKFDLRVYALITSCDPLRLYVYNEGLARFATKYYEEPNKTNITNMYMHLTNYSVNKFSRTYKIDPDEGSKRKLSTLNETLKSEYHDVPKIWKEIDDVIIKTVFLALPTLQHSYRAAVPRQNNLKTCFEVLGFDLILDENMKPYLLEVNHSPSFHTDAPIDRDVKESLLIDTFKILDLPKNTKNKVIQEDRKKATNRLLKDLTTHDSTWTREYWPGYFTPFQTKSVLTTRKSKAITAITTLSCGLINLKYTGADNYSTEDALRKTDQFELENIGNFRRIYPGDNTDKYNKYFCQGTSSLFHETFASRAREKATKLDQDNQERKTLEGVLLDPRFKLKPTKDKSFEWIFNKIRSEKCLQKIREELPKKALSVKSSNPEEEKVKDQEPSPKASTQLIRVPSNFFTTTPLEEKRITRFSAKQELLESVNVLEKIHTTMKTFGELRLRKDIKKVRKNKWSQHEENNLKRISLQNSLSDVIQHIDNRKAPPFEPNLNWQTYIENGARQVI